MNRSTPGLPVHYQLPESTQSHVHWVGDAIQPSHPLSSPSPPALNLSQHQVFSNESALRISWPNYWSYSFSISPSNEHPGLISFRMDWLDLLAERDLTVWITTKCGKFLRSWNTKPPDLPSEKSVCMSRSKLEPDMEQQTGSKLGTQYVKAVYFHLAF